MDLSPNHGTFSGHQTKSLDILYQNVRSLKAFVSLNLNFASKACKITLVQHFVYGSTYEIICIYESWLNETFLNGELLPGYSIFLRDRIGKIGGGMLEAVKENIHAIRRHDLEKENTELVVVELALKNCNSTLYILSIVHLTPVPIDAVQHLNSSLRKTPKSSWVILIGDLSSINLPAINWSLDLPTPTTDAGQLEESFCELVGDNFLQQFIKGPTHVRGNTLDFLLCNCLEVIKTVTTLPPQQANFPTGHYIIEFQIQQTFRRADAV